MATLRLIRRLREEFNAIPGLRVTEAQVQRLCGVDAATCASALRALVGAGFLRTAENGALVRADLVSSSSEVAMTKVSHVPEPPWRRIVSLVEFDGDTGESLSPVSHSAIRYATTLAVTHHARVTALHVVPRGADTQQELLARVTEQLRKTMSAEAFRGLIDVHVAVGTPHEELLRTATEIGADLVVLGRGDQTRVVPLSRLREV